MQTGAALFIAFIILQRLAELVIARRNTAALLEKGAHEIGAEHYPYMVAMHAVWVAGIAIAGYDETVSTVWLAAFIVLQAFRVWILATLGSRWTTRIIILNEPLVTKGPFRFMRHPNYALVIAEIIVAPMVLGLVWVAVIFTVLNAAMLTTRIRCEENALVPLRKSQDRP